MCLKKKNNCKELIDNCNKELVDRIISVREKYKGTIIERSPIFYKFESYYLDSWHHINPYFYDTEDEVKNVIAVKTKLVDDTIKSFEEKANKYLELGPANIRKIDEMIDSNEVPLFFTLTDLVDETNKRYFFCYEMKFTEKEGVYDVVVMPSNSNTSMRDTIYGAMGKIEKMTEKEFEEHYIMDRLSQKNFNSEEELVEYDNSIRRLFNGQRN